MSIDPKEPLENEKPRICITTYFDKNFEEIGSLCERSLKRYAELHNYSLVLHNDLTSDRPPPWNKILVLKSILENEPCDYVLWVDADAVLARYDRDIRSEIETDKEIYLVKHNFKNRELPNTGVMLLRNSAWSRKFLDDIWAMDAYTHHPWWENAAIMDYLGYREEISLDSKKTFILRMLHASNLLDFAIQVRRKINPLTNRWKSLKGKRGTTLTRQQSANLDGERERNDHMVKWLDLAWNVFALTQPMHDAIIHHYPARSLKVRLDRMNADLERAEQRR